MRATFGYRSEPPPTDHTAAGAGFVFAAIEGMQEAMEPRARPVRAEYNASVSQLRRIHDSLAILRVRPDFPIPPHEAGQYTTLGLGYWEPRVEGCQAEAIDPSQRTKLVKRAYSISSSILRSDGELLQPEDEELLEFYVVLVRSAEMQSPAFTPRLFALHEGSRLFVSDKITGRYTLRGVEPGQTVLFLATGTGEAPHNKMILELLRRSHRGRIASVVCVRYQNDLGYRDTHARLVRSFPNHRYLTLTTREPSNLQQKVYLQDLLRSGALEEKLDQKLDPAATHVFLCGNPKMIGVPRNREDGSYEYPSPAGVIELLEQRGFAVDRPRSPGNIHFEKYW